MSSPSDPSPSPTPPPKNTLYKKNHKKKKGSSKKKRSLEEAAGSDADADQPSAKLAARPDTRKSGGSPSLGSAKKAALEKKYPALRILPEHDPNRARFGDDDKYYLNVEPARDLGVLFTPYQTDKYGEQHRVTVHWLKGAGAGVKKMYAAVFNFGFFRIIDPRVYPLGYCQLYGVGKGQKYAPSAAYDREKKDNCARHELKITRQGYAAAASYKVINSDTDEEEYHDANFVELVKWMRTKFMPFYIGELHRHRNKQNAFTGCPILKTTWDMLIEDASNDITEKTMKSFFRFEDDAYTFMRTGHFDEEDEAGEDSKARRAIHTRSMAKFKQWKAVWDRYLDVVTTTYCSDLVKRFTTAGKGTPKVENSAYIELKDQVFRWKRRDERKQIKEIMDAASKPSATAAQIKAAKDVNAANKNMGLDFEQQQYIRVIQDMDRKGMYASLPVYKRGSDNTTKPPSKAWQTNDQVFKVCASIDCHLSSPIAQYTIGAKLNPRSYQDWRMADFKFIRHERAGGGPVSSALAGAACFDDDARPAGIDGPSGDGGGGGEDGFAAASSSGGAGHMDLSSSDGGANGGFGYGSSSTNGDGGGVVDFTSI